MLNKRLVALMLTLFSTFAVFSQTDSTALNLYQTDAVLETSLDSMLYGNDQFSHVVLAVSISDSTAFSKLHVSLSVAESNNLLFKHVYTLEELTDSELISDWMVTIPFGNLENTLGYKVTVVVEDYSGSLGTVITKTLNP